MTSQVELTQIIPAQPGIVARWHKAPTADNPSPIYTRPVAAWAFTTSGAVIGLVPSGSPYLVPVTDKYAYPQGDPVGDFADYRWPDEDLADAMSRPRTKPGG